MKIKTNELLGPALDWAVAKCEGICEGDGLATSWPYRHIPDFSEDWSEGGPIIEREDTNVNRFTHSEVAEFGKEIYRKDGWTAFTTSSAFWITPVRMYGPTPLIAAMRCYVASKLGDEVDVPEELLGGTNTAAN